MSHWRIIEDGPLDGALNMLTDEALFETFIETRNPPTIRFYEWERPCVSVGFLQKNYAQTNETLPMFRRPTGGGAVTHGGDFTFSVVADLDTEGIPRAYAESYRFLNLVLLKALGQCVADSGGNGNALSLWDQKEKPGAECFSGPTLYDIVCGGLKTAGAAQRRKRGAILYQATVLLRIIPEAGPRVSYPLSALIGREPSKQALKRSVVKAYQETFGKTFTAGSMNERERKCMDFISGCG